MTMTTLDHLPEALTAPYVLSDLLARLAPRSAPHDIPDSEITTDHLELVLTEILLDSKAGLSSLLEVLRGGATAPAEIPS